MKKLKLFLGLGVVSLFGFGLISAQNTVYNSEKICLKANSLLEGEEEVTEPDTDSTDTEEVPETPSTDESDTETDPEPEVFESKVVLTACSHGQISVDKTEGHVGDVVTVMAVHDMLYKVESVSVNGTVLVESEETSGKFTFALVEGENKIEAKFKIDEELCGELSKIIDQAMSGDWTNLFSVENVITLISFLLNGGILVAIARYFIKDKRLESKVEAKIEDVIKQIIPDSTKTTVLTTIEKFITPYFANIEAQFENVENALTVFSRCLALAQENTPEARIAITQELSSLSLSDQVAISNVQKNLQEFMEAQNKQMADLVLKLNDMHDKNTEIVEGTGTKEDSSSESKTEKETETESEAIPFE